MRTELLAPVKRIVIKIGSRVLTDGVGALDQAIIRSICAELATIHRSGKQIVLVSSGAVAAGRSALKHVHQSNTIPHKQAAAAIGQTRLMRAYEEGLESFGLIPAQLLLTSEDLGSRQRFLNAQATLNTLLGYGIIPIINENDTVVVDEIKFGDNDNLSALVTNVAEAQLLLIMTDIDGFYSADPRKDPDARLIPLVKTITREMERAAGGSGSSVGTGGMATKLAAAKKAAKNGVPTILLPGKQPGILAAALAGQPVGTLFLPATEGFSRRKHWIAYTLRPSGKVLVDSGARDAVLKRGKSLLPSGIIQVEGRFERGACIRICGSDGVEFARGLTDYSSSDITRLVGKNSSEIENILGYYYTDVIVHRDNMVAQS